MEMFAKDLGFSWFQLQACLKQGGLHFRAEDLKSLPT